MKRTFLAAGLCSLMMTACVTLPYQPYARQVKVQSKTGGVVALRIEHRTEDRQMAEGMMAQNCGSKKVEIVEEGEVVVGEKVVTEGNNYGNYGSNRGNPNTITFSPVSSSTQRSETEQKKEWHLTYKCI